MGPNGKNKWNFLKHLSKTSMLKEIMYWQEATGTKTHRKRFKKRAKQSWPFNKNPHRFRLFTCWLDLGCRFKYPVEPDGQ
jgi:hypothetical protein